MDWWGFRSMTHRFELLPLRKKLTGCVSGCSGRTMVIARQRDHWGARSEEEEESVKCWSCSSTGLAIELRLIMEGEKMDAVSYCLTTNTIGSWDVDFPVFSMIKNEVLATLVCHELNLIKKLSYFFGGFDLRLSSQSLVIQMCDFHRDNALFWTIGLGTSPQVPTWTDLCNG